MTPDEADALARRLALEALAVVWFLLLLWWVVGR
jgi:hypothetical protein